jgi:Domain of unknown function (DUF4845)
MNLNRHQQRGMANSTMVFLLLFIILGLWLFFNLFPFYLENSKVKKVLETIQANTEAPQKSEKELQKMVLDGLADKGLQRINNENVNDYVDITKTAEGFQITIKYEQRELITGNLFFLNKFEKTVATP